jgi:hypothetical protein
MSRKIARAAACGAMVVGLAMAPEVAVAAPSLLSPKSELVVRCSNTLADSRIIAATLQRSAEGDEIVFDGTCLVSETIPLLADRAYRGRSRTGTVIEQADGANLDAIFASDSYLENSPTTGKGTSLRAMTIKANSEANPDAHDALVVRSWQTVIEDIQISDATRHAIRLTNLSADGTPLENTQVNGRIAGNQINRSGGSGLYVEDTGNSVTDWQLQDNYFAGSGADGVYLENAAGWMITGNHIYGVNDAGSAIYADRLYGSSISDNYIEDFITTGITARVQGGSASTIANNRILVDEGVDGTHLYVVGNYGDAKASVTGNAIRGRGVGIGLDYQRGDADSLEVVSTGNLVSEVAVERQVGEGVTVSEGVLAEEATG